MQSGLELRVHVCSTLLALTAQSGIETVSQQPHRSGRREACYQGRLSRDAILFSRKPNFF